MIQRNQILARTYLHVSLLTVLVIAKNCGRKLPENEMRGTVYNNKINWTVSPVILETDASLMLVIQWLSDHKLLNKCAAGRL